MKKGMTEFQKGYKAGRLDEMLFDVVMRNEDGCEADIKQLLNSGANVNAVGLAGEPVIVGAVAADNAEVVELLINSGANIKGTNGWNLVYKAAEYKSGDALGVLLKHDVDVDIRNDKGTTPLMVVAGSIYADSDRILTLTKKGADVNAKDKDGYTPLMYACTVGKADVAEFLIEHGADVNAVDNKGGTALGLALRLKDGEDRDSYAFKDYEQTIQILRKHGAKGKENDMDNDGPEPGV